MFCDGSEIASPAGSGRDRRYGAPAVGAQRLHSNDQACGNRVEAAISLAQEVFVKDYVKV